MIEIDGNSMTLESFRRIVVQNESFSLSEGSLKKVRESFEFLSAFSEKKLIYGINTGFGPMAQYTIDRGKTTDLQYNIIRSHSSGMGSYLRKNEAKAVLFNLLHTMLRGFSGVHPDLVGLLHTLYSREIIPCIPLHGSVGASGDLVQMAHVALALIGEGEVYYRSEILPAARVFREENITPLAVRLREGIAVMNGTTAMTAVAALNWSLALSLILNEMMETYDDHFSEELNRVRRQSGQQAIAKAAREFMKDSQLIQSRVEGLYRNEIKQGYISHKVQEYYSLRCIPQILGPVYDTIAYTARIVENELNSTTDNPVVDAASNNVFHGGNFHGDYISLEMDKLKLAVTRISMLAERQVNYLMNPGINQRLKPFINEGIPGLNFGCQGIQFTATSTVAENQALSTSLYVHSIPNNNDNQDIVSMGFNAACSAGKVIDNTFEVLAIEAAAVLQATEQLQISRRLSSSAQAVYSLLKDKFPPLKNDRCTRPELQNLKQYLIQHPLQILY
jgi:histidine ammonia-lyase